MKRNEIVTISTFARQLGFKNAGDPKYRQLLKLAQRRGMIKIQQGGFRSDSKNHPRLVVLMRPFEEVKFIERAVFPSYTFNTTVDGYRLTKKRTGLRRLLKSGRYSQNKWWVCEDCKTEIRIGSPYASKVDFSMSNMDENQLPVRCKCISCFLNLIEDMNCE